MSDSNDASGLVAAILAAPDEMFDRWEAALYALSDLLDDEEENER